MAKEEDLKRVDLKVSINCCEGCKKKVMKALSIQGVLKTEIHPTLPRITVTSNIDARILVRKLAKIGKTAEVLPETQKPQKEEKGSDTIDEKTEKASVREKTKEGNGAEKPNLAAEKSSKSGDTEKSNNKSSENGEDSKRTDKGETKMSDGSETFALADVAKSLYPTIVATVPQVNCVVTPSMVQNNGNLMASHARVYYPVPYHTMNASAAASPCCVRGHYYHEPPVYHTPPVQSQAMGFADYFNDDNTVGCYIM